MKSLNNATSEGSMVANPQRGKRVAGQALYFQLYLALKERIFNGAYVLEAPLPTEDQLAAEFGVSRITARRAVLDLVAEGLLTRTAGRGTFLTSQPSLRRMLAPVSLDEQLRKTAEDTRVELLEFSYGKADYAIAQLLGLPESAMTVQHSRRLRIRFDQPVMLLDGFVPAQIGRKFGKSALKKKPLHLCLKDAGHPLAKLIQEFSAVSATPPVCDALAVALGTPLGMLERIGFDHAGIAVEYLRIFFVSDRVRLRTLSLQGRGEVTDAGQFVFP